MFAPEAQWQHDIIYGYTVFIRVRKEMIYVTLPTVPMVNDSSTVCKKESNLQNI